MTNLPKQKKLIEDGSWECLVILDACRYDYFNSIYADYFTGIPDKVISEGSCTGQWLERTWRGIYNDTIYVSGNPFINSLGEKIADFDGSKHFYKVFDVWDDGWSNKLKTVPPKEVYNQVKRARAIFPRKKIVAHFLQPHQPYIPLGSVTSSDKGIARWIRQIKGKEKKKSISSKTIPTEIREAFRNSEKFRNLWKIIKVIKWKFSGVLGSREREPVEVIENRYGSHILRELYKQNLRIALRYVSKLVDKLPGKVVVTSDHGEFLGEKGFYEHPSYLDNRIGNYFLREVPWLET